MQWGDVYAAIAALGSGGATAVIAKAYISKSLQNLEKVLEKVSSIDTRFERIETKFARIETKLERYDDTAETVVDHDRKLARIEERLSGRSTRKLSCDN